MWTLVAGCGGVEEVSTTTTTTFTATSEGEMPQPTLGTSTSAPTSTSTGSTSEGDDDGSTTGHPDTSTVQPDFGSDGPDCNGKIDILFVFDRHWYVENHWLRLNYALAATLPKFVEWFGGFDTHWMVAKIFTKWGIAACPEECAANEGETCEPLGPPDYPCGPHTDDSLTECDTVIGAGATFPAGFESANKRCELAGGERYIQSSEEPDLLAALQCITATGWIDGAVGHAELGMVEALKPTMTKVPGGCNLGFLRDDALLLIVYYSTWGGLGDSFAGEPAEWAEVIYDAKNGDKDKVAVVGIVTDKTSPEDQSICGKVGSVDYATAVEQFLHFEIKHAVPGSYCADTYVPYFEQGLELALALCGEQPPT